MAAKMYSDTRELQSLLCFCVSSSDSPNSFTLALSTGYNLHNKTVYIILMQPSNSILGKS